MSNCLQARFEKIMENVPTYPLVIFEVCAVFCMTTSMIMHMFWVKNKEMCEKVHKLDLIGILVQISGSGVCLDYYQYFCMPLQMKIYISITILIAVCVLYTMTCAGSFVRYIRGFLKSKFE
jgi:predicted membrane channel-forming protein YqfA (hemolysin III family)